MYIVTGICQENALAFPLELVKYLVLHFSSIQSSPFSSLPTHVLSSVTFHHRVVEYS